MGEFILMVHDQKITVANAKLVMMAIIDDDKRSPSQIAEEQGLMGGIMTSDEVRDAVMSCIKDEANAAVVGKILGGNSRPVMSLVGKVMKAVNRRGDPVVIKKMLEDEIVKKGT